MTVRTPQVWLPAQFADLTGLPPGLEYARWDGRSAFPSDRRRWSSTSRR
ncbi:hypothetical protein [Streptomyces rubrogriseus]